MPLPTRKTPMPSLQAASPASAVLDTNVVLDWLVFRDSEGLAIGNAIEKRRLRWLVTLTCRDELAHVLGRGLFRAWAPNEAQVWRRWEQFSTTVTAPDPMPHPRLRCTDPDDQKFLDLALITGADWLVSRDRAVLKLARRALPLGLRVLSPGQWTRSVRA